MPHSDMQGALNVTIMEPVCDKMLMAQKAGKLF